jgi:hypothetical protein
VERNGPVASKEAAGLSLLALAVCALFFWDYLPPFKRVHLWSDVVGYSYPLHRYAFAALKAGHFPLWDLSIYCGISFVGNLQAALFYPPTWLLYAAVWRLDRIPFKAIEIFALAHIWIAYVLAYLWLRGRAGRLASALGAATFALSGQMLYGLLHLGQTCATAWLPLGLWGIDQAARERSWRPLWKLAVASALTFLAGYPACWIVFCGVTVVYAVMARVGARTVATLAASSLLFAVQLLPALQAASLAPVDPRYFPSQYNWRALLLSHTVPNWFDFNPGHPGSFEPGCWYFYLGLPALFSIAWALWRRDLRPYAQAAVTLVFAWCMANPAFPMVRIVQRIPMLTGTMHPYEFYAGVAAMAALIVAIGVSDFQGRAGNSAIALVALGAVAAWQLSRGGQFPTGAAAALEVAIALAAFAYAMGALRTGRAKWAIVAFVLIDFHSYGAARWFNAAEGDEDRNHPAYGIGGVDDEAYRAMLANRQFRVATAQDAGPGPTEYRYWGLATPAGWDPLVPVQYRDAIERWTPFRSNREFWVDLRNDDMLQTLGVRFVLARRGTEVPDTFRLVGRADVFCPVYEYLRAKPPFRCEGGCDLRPVGWTAERRDFESRSTVPTRLALVEQFYPGWRATVDGQPVPIARWGGAFQAVALTAGEHRVVFEYHPASVRIGAAISALSVLAVALAAIKPARDARS